MRSMRTGSAWVLAAAGLVSLGVAVGVLSAGPLDPPAGPVTGTYKTLSDVEPRIAINAINTPGDADSTFKITQPGSYYLAGNIAGVSGKHGIEVVAGNVTIDLNGFALTGVAGALDGVLVSGSTNVAVLNGIVTNWRNGLQLDSTRNARVEGILASGNSVDGIRLGTYAIARRCVVSNNGLNGITSFQSTLIESCVARNNTGDGIVAGALGNVVRCESYANNGYGIRSTSSGYSLITECTVAENTLDGIRVASGVAVTRNVVSFNGIGANSAGIRATGFDNRIEENSVTNNNKGIEVSASGNFIARNIVTGSGANNWLIAANNVILVVVANNAAAFNGVSGGTAPGSTDPNANFSY